MGYTYKKDYIQFKHIPLEDSLKTGVYVLRHMNHHPETVVYVGRATSQAKDTIRTGFRLRWQRHLMEITTKFKCHHSPYLQNVCNKYGIEGLRFDILEFCSKEESAEIETKWIDKLNAYTKGYNGVKESIGGTGFKMYEHVLDKKRVNYARYTIEGDLVDTWKGLKSIKENLGIQFNTGTFDSSGQSAGGYLWRRYENKPEEKIDPLTDSRLSPILCYGLDGKFIKKYDRIVDATEELGVHTGNISKASRGISSRTGVACGYQWRRYTEEYPIEIEPFILITGHQKKVRVVNVTDGTEKIYNSMRQAAVDTKINRKWLQKKLNSGAGIKCRKEPKIEYKFYANEYQLAEVMQSQVI